MTRRTSHHRRPTADGTATTTEWRVRVLAHGLLVATVAVLAVAVLLAGPGVAQNNSTNVTLNDTAPYYDNETALGNQSSWFPQNDTVTLDVLGDLTSRLGPYVIGTGDQIPGGTTYAGTLVTGVVMVGVFVGALAFTSVGAEGGVVVAAVVGFGLTELGLAPSWLRIVLLMLIGLVASIAARRAVG